MEHNENVRGTSQPRVTAYCSLLPAPPCPPPCSGPQAQTEHPSTPPPQEDQPYFYGDPHLIHKAVGLGESSCCWSSKAAVSTQAEETPLQRAEAAVKAASLPPPRSSASREPQRGHPTETRASSFLQKKKSGTETRTLLPSPASTQHPAQAPPFPLTCCLSEPSKARKVHRRPKHGERQPWRGENRCSNKTPGTKLTAARSRWPKGRGHPSSTDA